MNKYTQALIGSTIATVGCILISISASGDYEIAATIGIGVFWLGSLVFLFLRGLAWYRQDLAERALEEAEKQSDENTNNTETDQKVEIDFD